MCRFTSQCREFFEGPAGVCVTTYTMVAYGGQRSAEGERIMRGIMGREWGLLLLDEVGGGAVCVWVRCKSAAALSTLPPLIPTTIHAPAPC